MPEKTFLRITVLGDPSVGLNDVHFDLEYPLIDVNPETDGPELEHFRRAAAALYAGYFDERIRAEYDFELKNEPEM